MRKDFNLLFGEYITIYRNSLAMSRKELADQVNVSTTFIGYIETGKRFPDIELTIEIAKYLAIDLSILMEKRGQALLETYKEVKEEIHPMYKNELYLTFGIKMIEELKNK